MAGVGVGIRQGVAAIGVRVVGELAAEEEEEERLRALGLGEDGDDPPEEEEDEEARRARIARNQRRMRERDWIKNFYVAYDALENVDLLIHGIHLSMEFQRSLVRAGVAILDKQITKTLKSFRLTVLAGASSSASNNSHSTAGRVGAMVGESDFAMFGRSVTLLGRLGTFLMDAFREHNSRLLPLVIAAYNDETDAYLVLGTFGAKRSGDVRKNPFGIAFQMAAERTEARLRNVNFDSSVAEVESDDLLPFLETLQLRSNAW
ncbi:hypothetical protein HK101_004576 [Irineochytrium annulatum]|nr:hypothetical protein HK101_004576 [Irineochytrium annulatum]